MKTITPTYTDNLTDPAMESLMTARPQMAIAHRLSTSERCDRDAFVVDGELGPYDDLVSADGHDAELFAAWTSGLAA